MKTKKINYAFILLLIFGGLMTSCVKDDDFSTPDTNINPPEIDGDTIDISGVKSLFMQQAGVSTLEGFNGSEQLTFQGTNFYMTGYVISSDEAGNFHQELVLQDKSQNPTAGIKIMIEANPLFTKFEVGRKVYVQLDGFTVGFSNGVIALGIPNAGSDFVNRAPRAFESKILRTPTKDSIVPLELNISDFKRKYDNTFIRLNNVEFPANIALGDNAKTYAAEPGEQYDAERTLESCDSNATTALMTSTFADFKALKLPKGSGSIDAILTKTFNGSAYRLKLNDVSTIHFSPERCDGEDPGDGDDGDGDGDVDVVSLPFYEDFEGLVDYESITHSGWTNQDVTGSGRLWEARSFDGNGYAQLTAYNAGSPVETWLITPGLDLTSVSQAQLSFETKDGHYNGDVLSIYVSTDFGGNASNATWTEVSGANISTGHTNGYGDNFISSGAVDLSDYLGEIIVVGFKYEGSNNGATTTMQIDNILISEDGNNDGGDDDNDGDVDPPSSDAALAFPGGDFEDWNAFLGGMNSFGIQSYATQGTGSGVDGSASLKIATDPGTTDGNDYVFTSYASSDMPDSYNKISFYIKGYSSKSVSLNVYKADGSYYVFNLGSLTSDATLSPAENNQYNGNINTGGDWVLVNLDLSTIADLNTDSAENFFALKIGKNADYDLHFDNFTIE